MKLIKNDISISFPNSIFFSDDEVEIEGEFLFNEQKNVFIKKSKKKSKKSPAWLKYASVEIELKDDNSRIIYHEYYASGKLRKVIPFTKDKVSGDFYVDGKVYLYYEDKNSFGVDTYCLVEEKEYVNTLRAGVWKTYSIDGGLLRETFYDVDYNHITMNNVIRWKEYYNSNGQLAQINEKDFGKAYYENGNLKAEWTCDNFTKHGKFIEYYENGNTKLTVNYIDGNRDGIMLKYYHNQRIKEEWDYSLGTRNYVKKFNEDESLVTEIIYKNGIEFSRKQFSLKNSG